MTTAGNGNLAAFNRWFLALATVVLTALVLGALAIPSSLFAYEMRTRTEQDAAISAQVQIIQREANEEKVDKATIKAELKSIRETVDRIERKLP